MEGLPGPILETLELGVCNPTLKRFPYFDYYGDLSFYSTILSS